MTAPLRVAVIGTGLGSPPHFLSLRDLAAEVEVAWILGRRASEMAAAYGMGSARIASRLDDVLRDASVHAAVVLTPPNTHLEVVKALAEAGKHVLVEKPLELSLARATELVEVCERHGVMLGVMLQHRMRPAALALKELIASGELGSLVSAGAFIRWWRPQAYYDEPGRGTLARDGGGVLMTQAIHTLDLLLTYTGLPQRLVAMAGTTALHRMETEDLASALVQFGDGVTAVVHATTAAFPGFPERIELNFTGGSATLEGLGLRVNLMDGRFWDAGLAQGSSGGGADPMAFDHGPHGAVLGDFFTAIETGRSPAVSGRSALAVQQLIEAMMASSRSGAAVSL